MREHDDPCSEPRASRPHLPEYGILDADQGRGLLSWSWAQERLERTWNYWVATTRPDGRPHAMAVWGVWLDQAFYFSTGRLTRKARNLAQNPSCVICTESAAEAVIVEGIAEAISDPAFLTQLASVYQAKYQESYPNDSNVYAVRPKVVFGFVENAAEFAGSATRWSLSDPTT
jgi:general stress protein 26